MSSPTPQPWLDSPAAFAIGPVELVCRPRPWLALFRQPALLWLAPLLLLHLAASVVAVVALAISLATGSPLLWVFVLFPLGVTSLHLLAFLLAVRWILSSLPVHLLIGARGLLWWSPPLSRIVLWADLGTVWMLEPSLTDPDGWVLRRSDGTTIPLDARLTDYLAVVARVLQEMPRAPVPTHEPVVRQPSEAIAPGEHGVSEPQA
jgi:hypothetical protein